MFYKAYSDPSIGLLGRVVVAASNVAGCPAETVVDSEKVLKHPFALRVRCWFAAWRIVRRQRKLAKFNANHSGLKA